MAWTQAQIDALEEQIANWGATKTITFANQTYTKDDLPALLALLQAMKASLRGSTTRFAATSKGA